MTKPTLHEIAAMPFPSSRSAMREHYDKAWGCDAPDDGVMRKFAVTVDVTLETSETYTVEAFTEEEAEEVACGFAEDDHGHSAYVDVVKIAEIDA